MLVLGALGSVGGAHSASAATLSCDTPSLISAIATANGTPGGGTLVLATGCVYTLESANNTTEGGTGLPVITGNVMIQGAGATIARSTATGVPAFRIFDVASGGILTLNSLTLSNGLANNGQQGGGAIFNHGTLAVTAGHVHQQLVARRHRHLGWGDRQHRDAEREHQHLQRELGPRGRRHHEPEHRHRHQQHLRRQ